MSAPAPDQAQPEITHRTIRLSDYKPHPRNYNRHPARQIERIAASLIQFGQPRSIVVWRGYFLAGHGVAEAARSLGWETLHANVLPDDYPEHKALAYLAADNELARMGDPDQAALAAILEESAAIDADLLQAIGYDDRELGELLAQLDRIANQDAEPQETEAERLRELWQTAAGQLWQCGAHRVTCGDSTDPATWARLMGDERIDCVWTDPPYGVDYGDKNAMLGLYDKFHRIQTPIHNDDAGTPAAMETARAALALACQYSRPGAAIYVTAPSGPDLAGMMKAFDAAGWDRRQTLVWIKNNIILGRTDYNYQHEPIIYGWKPGAAHTWADIAPGTSVIDDEAALRRMSKPALIALIEQMRNEQRTDVLRISKPQVSALHPTMKPPPLIVATAKNNTYPGHIIADPFGGSGSTLIAAQQIERRARLIEIDAGYTAVILQRYKDVTQDTPRRIDP